MRTYEQLSGKLRDEDSSVIGFGYSGRDFDDDGMFVGGKNNPDKEQIEGIGPIPTGIYYPAKLYPQHPHVGKNAILLVPDAETRDRIESYGRDPDSFYMHGDNAAKPGEASDGCIVMAPDVRSMVWADRQPIKVVSGKQISDLDGEIAT